MKLRADLPDDIYWLTEKVESLVKPVAYLVKDKNGIAPQGSTRNWGAPDIPVDAPWAQSAETSASCHLSISEGESFIFQINLEEIPESVRKPEWPTVGVVWVFGELWNGIVKFDPRPAADIKWLPRLDKVAPCASRMVLSETVPDCTSGTLPEIERVKRMVDDYWQWAQKNYFVQNERFGDFKIGGWVMPCQGDFDERNQDFVCELSGQHFGDNGCASLHYNKKDGFYAILETH